MEILRLLRILRMSDNWALAQCRQAYHILVNAIYILCALIIVEYFCNIKDYQDVNIYLGLAGLLGIVVNAIHPGIVLRVFEAGAIVGVPDPSKGFWQGGEDFLKTYARGVKSLLLYFSITSFGLGLISFAEYPKMFWVLLLGVVILILWPKEA